MAINDYSNYNSDSGYQGFNYGTETDALKRKRLAAQALAQMTTAPSQGQVIQNGVGTFYAGANPMVSGLAKVAAGYLSGKENSDLDQSQRNLDNTSQNALAYQLDPSNSASAKQAAWDQSNLSSAAAQAAAMNQRDANNNLGQVDTSSSPDSGAQSFPVRDGNVQTTDLPPSAPAVTPQMKQVAAKILLSPTTPNANSAGLSQAADSQKANVPSDPNLPSDNSVLAPGALDNLKSIGSAAKAKIAAALAGIQHITGADGSQPNMGGAPSAPVAPVQPPVAPPVQPAVPQGNFAVPQAQPRPPVQPAPQVAPQPPVQQAPQPVQPTVQAPQPVPSGSDPVQQAMNSVVNPDGSNTSNRPPSAADQFSQIMKIANTGPMGQQIAQAQLAAMAPQKDRFEPIKNTDGEVTGIFDKFAGRMVTGSQPPAGSTLKVQQADMDMRKAVDPNNPQAVASYNQWRTSRGMEPLDANTIAGTNMTSDQRASRASANASSISSIAKERSAAQDTHADLSKLSSDLGTGIGLATQYGGKYSGVLGTLKSYFGGGAGEQTLQRIANDSTLMSIMQDKGGSGTAGYGLMKNYQEHGLNAQMTPEALAQGLSQIKEAVDSRIAAKSGEIAAHNFSLKALGYTDPTSAGPAAPASANRAPGHYNF